MTNIWDSFQRFIDKLLVNLSSREFQVFSTATFLLWKGTLDISNWVIIACAYMGFRFFQKVKEKEIEAKNENSKNPVSI